MSAVVVSLITGLGSSLQGLVTDTLFGEDKPAATARPVSNTSSAVTVAVLPGESSAFLVSGQRVGDAADRAVLTGPYDQPALNRLFRKIGAVSLIKTAYKLSVTNTSSSPVTVVDIVPVITRRAPALDATMIEPLGGVQAVPVRNFQTIPLRTVRSSSRFSPRSDRGNRGGDELPLSIRQFVATYHLTMIHHARSFDDRP
ncbi:hypothetical protein [[Kitasatospora] papulosa]|uniref:hypothetical protein n=1 Tax=[Kitasatospora] papulosa TaxID=1464011 RepID=UPI00381070F1